MFLALISDHFWIWFISKSQNLNTPNGKMDNSIAQRTNKNQKKKWRMKIRKDGGKRRRSDNSMNFIVIIEIETRISLYTIHIKILYEIKSNQIFNANAFWKSIDLEKALKTIILKFISSSMKTLTHIHTQSQTYSSVAVFIFRKSKLKWKL